MLLVTLDRLVAVVAEKSNKSLQLKNFCHKMFFFVTVRFRRLTHFFSLRKEMNRNNQKKKYGETFNGNSRKCIENHLHAAFHAHSYVHASISILAWKKIHSNFDEIIYFERPITVGPAYEL